MSTRRLACWLAVLVCATALPAASRPASISHLAHEAILSHCIDDAARGRPWLAKTLWALRDQEGGWIGAAIPNADGSFDLGPLQVNSWWVSRIATTVARRPAEVRSWLQYNACFNVDAARWIFVSALSITRDYWRAIGVYHSPVAWRQRTYATAVARRLSRRFGKSVVALRTNSRSVRAPYAD